MSSIKPEIDNERVVHVSNELSKKIVDKILASKLNITVIPDFIERQIYEMILQSVLEVVLIDLDMDDFKDIGDDQ